MNIFVMGAGCVGLVIGSCLAELGNNVFCLDVDQSKIDMLNRGEIPIHEPGLNELAYRNRTTGRLIFSIQVAASVAHVDIQFIAVGTPPDEGGRVELPYVLASVRNIGRYMDSFKVVVDKSTVPVGTAKKVRVAIAEELSIRSQGAQSEFSVVEDFVRPTRTTLVSVVVPETVDANVAVVLV